jgi:hypothetical protein
MHKFMYVFSKPCLSATCLHVVLAQTDPEHVQRLLFASHIPEVHVPLCSPHRLDLCDLAWNHDLQAESHDHQLHLNML